MNPERVESLFSQYLDRQQQEADLSADAFLAHLSDSISAADREALLALLEDYQALREGRASRHASRPWSGPVAGAILDDYELLRPLGRGGMGMVWEARQRSLGRSVALKLLHPHLLLSERVLARFRREAQAAGRLHHSGVVTVHGIGETDGQCYIVQELIADGRSLEDDLLEEEQRLAQADAPPRDYRQLATWMMEMARALAEAHAHGIVHRDLKPGNILLQDGHPKLADFGLAHLGEASALSLTGELLGTPYYMSPEQARAQGVVDERSDLFSLGATFYRLLTLSLPFPGDSREQVLAAIRHEEVIPPRRLRSRIPTELATIVVKLLEKAPAMRYPSAEALAEDLQRFLDGKPIHAKPPGALTRSWKFARRHPTPSLALAVAVAAIAIILPLFFAAVKARDQADAATTLAEQRLGVAEAIQKFLIGLFEDAGPGGEVDAQTPAGELVQRASAKMEAEPAEEEDPAIRAGLLSALGQVNQLLGNRDLAEKELREALALEAARSELPTQSLLEVQNRLGLLLLQRAQLEEAESLLIAAQEGHEALYGKDDPRALENQGNLAYVYYAQGDLDRAAPLLAASLRGTEALWGPDHFHTWSARNNLAALQMQRGELAPAEALFEAIVAHRQEAEGPAAPATLSALSNLASCERHQEKFDEAEAHLQLMLQGSRQTYGDVHPVTASALRDFAGLRRQQARPEEALAMYREAAAIGHAKLRAGHPSTLLAEEGVVRCLMDLHRAQEALPIATQLAADAATYKVKADSRQRLLERVQAALSGS